MNGSFVALNISSGGVKLAQIRQQNGSSLVQGIWHVRADQEPDVHTEDRLRETVQEKITGARRTLLVIGSEDITYREFTFPFTSSKKVIEAIRFETVDEFPPEKYIADPIEIISSEPSRKAFLVAIIERDILRKRISTAEVAGLSIMGITSDVSTLGNYFIDENEALVMEAGPRQTLFVLYSHRFPILVRVIPIGLRDLKRKDGGTGNTDIKPIASEIKRTLLSFSAKSRFDLNKVHLSGSLVGHNDLIQALNEATGLHFVDQPPAVSEFEAIDQRANLNAYGSLLGAARWKKKAKVFDFYMEEFAGADAIAPQKTYLRWGGVVLVSFLLVFFLSSWLKVLALQKRDNFLRSETRKIFTSTFPQVSRVVDEVKQARTLLEARKAEVGSANPISSVSVLDILDSMSQSISKEVYFQVVNLYWERGRLEIDGRTDSFKTVNVIQELLSKSRDFPEVTISNAKTRNDGQDVDFKITIRIAG